MTVNDVITLALKANGMISGTETAPPDLAADAFTTLNLMLDSWAADRLTIYGVVRSVYTLVAGQQVYTIGKSGTPDFNAVRPVWIQDAGIISTVSSPSFELPVRILSDDEWAQIRIKGFPSTLSWSLYYDYAVPNGNISMWPVPGASSLQLALYVPTPIPQFTTITDAITLPPGYAEAVLYNLAVRLCTGIKQVDPLVAILATNGKALIERANKRLDPMGMDSALMGANNRRVFNWILGTAGSR